MPPWPWRCLIQAIDCIEYGSGTALGMRKGRGNCRQDTRGTRITIQRGTRITIQRGTRITTRNLHSMRLSVSLFCTHRPKPIMLAARRILASEAENLPTHTVCASGQIADTNVVSDGGSDVSGDGMSEESSDCTEHFEAACKKNKKSCRKQLVQKQRKFVRAHRPTSTWHQ